MCTKYSTRPLIAYCPMENRQPTILAELGIGRVALGRRLKCGRSAGAGAGAPSHDQVTSSRGSQPDHRSISSHQSASTGPFPALKLSGLYRGPTVSTFEKAFEFAAPGRRRMCGRHAGAGAVLPTAPPRPAPSGHPVYNCLCERKIVCV